jgi:dUTP pyrophosphatase
MLVAKIKKLNENAVIPTKAHPSDAGFDMTATSIKSTEEYIEYGTGIAMRIPDGHVGLLFPRSSNSKKDLLMCNSVGVIDCHYTGEIKFRFKRIANPMYEGLAIHSLGDRIGQIMIIPYPEVQFDLVDELENTDRGSSGFGDSGQ